MCNVDTDILPMLNLVDMLTMIEKPMNTARTWQIIKPDQSNLHVEMSQLVPKNHAGHEGKTYP